jgi:hypothetical protein
MSHVYTRQFTVLGNEHVSEPKEHTPHYIVSSNTHCINKKHDYVRPSANQRS